MLDMKSRVWSRAMMTMTRPRSTSTEARRFVCAARFEVVVLTVATAEEVDAVTMLSPTNNCSSVARGNVLRNRDVSKVLVFWEGYLMSFIASIDP